jgi:glycosyltransferase involved in cell wall biosynthesis
MSFRCPTLTQLPPPLSGKTGWPWTEESPQLPETMPVSSTGLRTDGSPWPRISIVTPSYDQGHFIEETIRSVLLQGYPNLEYIIIDGGSTDGSVEIIKKYEPWLTYWVSEKDEGQSHAINKGWQRSSGQILAWLNSDDILNAHALGEVASIWQQDSRYGFISGATELVDQSGVSEGKTFGSEFDLTETLITSQNCVAQQSTFMSHSALHCVGCLDIDLHMSMDWDLWLRIGSRFPVKFVPHVWSRTRLWSDSKTSTMLYLSGSEHVHIVRNLFKYRDCGLSPTIRCKALAAAYGREAVLHYRHSDHCRFRQAIALSLLYCPTLKGGDARKFLPDAVPGMRMIQAFLSLGKRVGKKLRAIP